MVWDDAPAAPRAGAAPVKPPTTSGPEAAGPGWRRGWRSATAVLVAAAVVLAGCGGGGESGDGIATLGGDAAAADDGDGQSSEGTAEEQLLQYNECLREQGIDVPDPSVDSEGNITFEAPASGSDGDEQGLSGPGISATREDFEEAREVCGDPPAAVFGGPGGIDETELADALLEFAQCMRDNGIDVPDPDLSEFGPGGPPVTSDSGSGDGDEGNGAGSEGSDGSGPQMRIGGPFGELDLSDLEVQDAVETCQEAGILPGPGGRRGPGGGATAGGGTDGGGTDGGGEEG